MILAEEARAARKEHREGIARQNSIRSSNRSRQSVKLQKSNSRRTITFTKHENGGPTIIANPDKTDLNIQLKELTKYLKNKKAKNDMKIADILVQLTTSQRHDLERLYDESNKKPLRSLFDDKKRKSVPGFKGESLEHLSEYRDLETSL